MSVNNELPFGFESEEVRKLKYAVNKMEHDLFFLYVFLTSEGICDDALGYLENHSDDPVPFRTFL